MGEFYVEGGNCDRSFISQTQNELGILSEFDDLILDYFQNLGVCFKVEDNFKISGPPMHLHEVFFEIRRCDDPFL